MESIWLQIDENEEGNNERNRNRLDRPSSFPQAVHVNQNRSPFLGIFVADPAQIGSVIPRPLTPFDCMEGGFSDLSQTAEYQNSIDFTLYNDNFTNTNQKVEYVDEPLFESPVVSRRESNSDYHISLVTVF